MVRGRHRSKYEKRPPNASLYIECWSSGVTSGSIRHWTAFHLSKLWYAQGSWVRYGLCFYVRSCLWGFCVTRAYFCLARHIWVDLTLNLFSVGNWFVYIRGLRSRLPWFAAVNETSFRRTTQRFVLLFTLPRSVIHDMLKCHNWPSMKRECKVNHMLPIMEVTTNSYGHAFLILLHIGVQNYNLEALEHSAQRASSLLK